MPAELDTEATLRWALEQNVDLYKFYLDVSVKAAVFLMAVSGAIASFVLSKPSGPIIGISLAFPALINAGFAIFWYCSIAEGERMARLQLEIAAKLSVDAINMSPLPAVCRIFSIMCLVATIGLILLMILHLREGP